MSREEPRAPYDVNPVVELNPAQNGRNLGHEKETVSTYTYAVVVDGKIETPITIRCYMGRSRNASTVYATVWAHGAGGDPYISGHGRAGGYGYHKESAAIDEAMRSAGVKFERSFGGCGDGPVRVAVESLAVALGWPAGGQLI